MEKGFPYPLRTPELLHFTLRREAGCDAARDRSQSDDKTSVRLPWWTPVSAYATFGDFELVSAGEAQWEDPRGPWTYAKVQVLDVQYNVNR